MKIIVDKKHKILCGKNCSFLDHTGQYNILGLYYCNNKYLKKKNDGKQVLYLELLVGRGNSKNFRPKRSKGCLSLCGDSYE